MFKQRKSCIFYALEMYCYAVLCNITTDIFRAESEITKYRQPAGAVDRDPERRDGERGHRAMYGKPIKKEDHSANAAGCYSPTCRGNSMSFRHWSRFIKSFRARQAARGTQRIRAETMAGPGGENGRQTRQ